MERVALTARRREVPLLHHTDYFRIDGDQSKVCAFINLVAARLSTIFATSQKAAQGMEKALLIPAAPLWCSGVGSGVFMEAKTADTS